MKYNRIICLLLLAPVFTKAQSDSAIGRGFLEHFFTEQYDSAATYFDPSLRAQVTPEFLKKNGQEITTAMGKFHKISEAHPATVQGYKVWRYYSAFDKSKIDIQVVFSTEHKLLGFSFVPHVASPAENTPDSIGKGEDAANSQDPEELRLDSINKVHASSYNIQSDDLLIPGTLLVADKNNKKKLVILVHGSGPNDRDETIGENKPFKDIAEGLLQQGISSYRYDKRTKVAPQTMQHNDNIDREVTDDAVNIIQYFHANDTFRNYKLYLIGHSLGAMMAPRIALRSPSRLSGVVMLAGPARPFLDVAMQQLIYLDSLQPNPPLDSILKTSRQQVQYLHSPAFNAKSPIDSMPFNQPAVYWQSIMSYNQVKAFKKTTIPFLFLQGGKDYQITREDYALWKKAARGRANDTFKFYPDVFHLFIKSYGTPGPQDYQVPGKVSPKVIADIGAWITSH